MKKNMICLLLFFAVNFLARGQAETDQRTSQDSTKTTTDSAMQSMEGMDMSGSPAKMSHEEADKQNPGITASLKEFPTLHPMVVHFPIILLLVAAAIQFINLYFRKKEYDWIVTALVFVGALTAWLAGKSFHPHTGGLTEHAKLVLERHEFWADWTVYLSIAALLLQLLNQFLWKQKKRVNYVVALLLAGSAFSVSMAGHHGAQLAYIEGIGPQGKFLMDEKSEMKH